MVKLKTSKKSCTLCNLLRALYLPTITHLFPLPRRTLHWKYLRNSEHFFLYGNTYSLSQGQFRPEKVRGFVLIEKQLFLLVVARYIDDRMTFCSEN